MRPPLRAHQPILVPHLRWIPLSVSALLLSLAATASAGTLQGSATYRERMLLPPDAVFEVLLLDVSKADAPGIVLGRATSPASAPPFLFSIDYDDAAVLPEHRYAVRASIRQQGRLRFTTTRAHSVLNGDSEPLELMLTAVRARPAAGDPAAAAKRAATLRGTDWKLVRVGDASMTGPHKNREPRLLLAIGESRIFGSGGCNRFTGGFRLDGDQLSFTQMAATMMACVDGMEQEQHFFKALENTRRYRIQGQKLELLDADGKVLADLETS